MDYGYTASATNDPALPRFLRITDIVGTHISWPAVPGCHVEQKRLEKFALRTGDIVVARTGATVGHAKRIREHPQAVFASYLVRFRPQPDVNPSFVGAVVESQEYKNWVLQHAGGAAQPNANAKILGSFRFLLPDGKTQERVGAVLDSFEHLIENNRRRIELLEQIAQSIYKEWFVHFRYPGHEHATFVDSPLGPIPDGWELTTCGSALTVLGGGTPSKKEATYWEGGSIPWYTPSDLTRRRTRFASRPATGITENGLDSSSARLFPAGSVLMTSRATLGVLAIATTEATCNQGFIVISPDDRWPPSFMLEWLDHHAEDFEALGTGATFKEITKGAFKRFPFLVPAPRALDDFREAVVPIDATIASLEASVDQLTSIRDLLLPKLVTGQIDVSELDLDAVVGSVA